MEVVLDRLLRALPDLVVLIVSLLGQIAGVAWLIGWRAAGASVRTKISIAAVGALSMAASTLAFLLRFPRVARHFPGWWISWGTGLAIAWAMLSLCWLAGYFAIWICSRMGSRHSPARRHFFQTAYAAVFAAPPAVLGYGVFIERHQLFLREQKLEIPNLAPELDGLRLVQLTDIHLSPFLSRAELQRAVDMANETRAHIALVTGDLITTFRDPLDDCLDILAQLRADAGVFGCMGNHEIYANAEADVEREGARRGMRFLRSAAAPLRFGNAVLNLAGVDYQRLRRRYLVGAEKLVVPGALNVLLSHNPDVFPVAARQGFDLTIAGHTHGGQIRVELLSADLNPGRFYTPYVDGVYRRGPASIFVSRGIGTIALPARLGAPPEVSLVRLCRS
jgi:predicted MPP superfamily phosphohydrolase